MKETVLKGAGLALIAAMAQALSGQALFGQASAQQPVGTAGAVNPAAQSSGAGGTRVLQLGASVIQRERIQTTAGGTVQVLFIDRTTLNVGPDSDVLIDEFVFNPATGNARMGVTLGKGVMRLVGGSATKEGETRVNTPVATIGVRGGVATISHDARTGTKATNIFGTMQVKSRKRDGCARVNGADCNEGGGTEVVRRPHFSVTVGGPGQDPSAPVEVSQAEIDATNRLLTSKGGQFGGAPVKPTDLAALRAGTGYENGPIPALNIRDSIPSGYTTVNRGNVEVIAAQQLATPRPKPSSKVRAPQAFALTMSADPRLNANGVPYVVGSFAAAGGFKVSKVLGYANGGVNADGSANLTAKTLQAGLAINGSGSGQGSTLLVATSSIAPDASGQLASSGVFRASTRLAANQPAGFAAGSVTSQQGTVTSDSSGVVTGYAANTNTYDSGTGAYLSNSALTYAGANSSTSFYTFQQQASATSPVAPGTRAGAQLNGYAAGLAQTVAYPNAASDAGTATGQSFAVAGGAQFNFNANASSVQANFNLVPLTSSGSGANAYQGAALQFGNVSNDRLARSAFIDDGNFAATDAVSSDAGGVDAPLSTVNGRALRSSRLALVSSEVVDVKSFFPAVAFCNCEFTKWGVWAADTSRNSANSGQTFSDRTQLGFWVAGQLPAVGDVPTVGTATYTGHVIAAFNNAGNEYVSAGGFANAVNVGAKTGAVSVTGLDGRNYAGSVFLGGNASNAAADARTFAGTGSATSGGAAAISFNGSFFRGSTGPVQEMGGTVLVQGANYTGSGIFAARR